MIRINTKTDIAAGTWKEFADGVKCKLRPCTGKDYRKAIKGIAADDQLAPVQVITHHACMEWEGFVDQDGNPLPCTPEMIDTVGGIVDGLTDWMVVESRKIEKDLLLKDEADLKN